MKTTIRSVTISKFILSAVIILVVSPLYSQTCCTGGIPIAGNITFENSSTGNWQVGVISGFNLLHTLKEEDHILKDDSRKRNVYSLLFRSGYSITENLVAGAVVPFIRRERWITHAEATNFSYAQGLGDIILTTQYRLPFSNFHHTFRIGVGSKMATGRSDIKNPQGLTYNMDMQPGSGSFDWFFQGAYDRLFRKTPTLNFSLRVFYRLNGKNNDYLGSQTHQFGNEWQILTGLSKQWLILSEVFNTSLLLKLRNMKKNRINDFPVPNTGGIWLRLIPSVSYQPTQQTKMSLVPEIPVYSKLNGTQLTTSFSIQLSFSTSLGQSAPMDHSGMNKSMP